MKSGDRILLDLVAWDWFVSCTVKERNASSNRLRGLFFALKYQLCKSQKLDARNVPWALRIESGVDPCHRHFHFLVGGLKHVGQGERFKLIASWSNLVGTKDPENPRGTCRARLYDPARGAVGYLTDALNASELEGWLSSDIEMSDAAYREAWLAHRARSGRAGQPTEGLRLLA